MKLKITPAQARALVKLRSAPAFTWTGPLCTCDLQDTMTKEYWARGQGPTEDEALEASFVHAVTAPRAKTASEVAAEAVAVSAENLSLRAKLAELEALAKVNAENGNTPPPRRARRVTPEDVPTEPDAISS